MKIGTQTNSLVNHLYSHAAGSSPEVGMGATILLWTDRKAATIVNIDGGARPVLTVREDRVTRTDTNGMSENQEYVFTPNENGATHTFRQDRDGKWQAVHKNTKTGRWIKSDGACLLIGKRDHYHDFSF